MSDWYGEWLSRPTLVLYGLALFCGMCWGMAIGFEMMGLAVITSRVTVFQYITVCLLAAFWISGRYDLYLHRLTNPYDRDAPWQE